MDYSPFKTKLIRNEIALEENKINYTNNKLSKTHVFVKAGLRIGKSRFTKEEKLKAFEQEIIQQIHAIRFNKKNPYVITGGHFDQLFVRNLGIFYNALLDPRIPCASVDWTSRQEIALKTVALDLKIFQFAGKDYTTIVPLGKNIFTCVNVYARPSDSLFAILYTILALTDDTFIETVFPCSKVVKQKLQSKKAAQQLLEKYKNLLSQLINRYYKEIIDPNNGLVKTDLLLSGARDGIKRASSFYDNVIVWATIRLAKKLHAHTITALHLENWKEKIIKIFWNETEGIFIDDLSSVSKNQTVFSADSFIVLSTGFLNLKKSNDMNKLKRMIQYVKRKKLDYPFPLRYSIRNVPKNLFRPVRYFAPSYMEESIWSHWGMEYIKALIYTGNKDNNHFSDAGKHLNAYKLNIEKYGGYPELYDKTGTIFKERLYKSVLYNGWVINYEQAKMLFATLHFL